MNELLIITMRLLSNPDIAEMILFAIVVVTLIFKDFKSVTKVASKIVLFYSISIMFLKMI